MPIGLKRHYGRGDLHFLTFNCYRRLPLLGTSRARNIFVRALGQMRKRYGFRLVGYVVMPNHVHLLMSESAKDAESIEEEKSKTAPLKPKGAAPTLCPAAKGLPPTIKNLHRCGRAGLRVGRKVIR